MARMHRDEPIHLGVDLLGRAIGVHDAVSHRVVGAGLPLAFHQREVHEAPERVDALSRVLAVCQGLVELPHVRGGHAPVALDEPVDAVQRGLLVVKHPEHILGRLVGHVGSEQCGQESALDQRLSGFWLDVVEVFDGARLDRPLAPQPLGELGQLPCILELFPHHGPSRPDLWDLGITQIIRACVELGDPGVGIPDRLSLQCIHECWTVFSTLILYSMIGLLLDRALLIFSPLLAAVASNLRDSLSNQQQPL